MTSKADRDAYERGQKDAEFARENPIGDLIGGPIHGAPSDPSQKDAYSKGINAQQLDNDKK
jgi:hypothetical protein